MEVLLHSVKFDVVRMQVEARDGSLQARDVVRHPGAVVVLPLLDENTCIMIRQWRPAIDRELWELPAGTLDVPGEDPKAAAERELEEEAGYQSDRLEWLCRFYPSPGFMTELIEAYVAHDLKATRQDLEPTERIVAEAKPVSEVLEMIRDGRIVDAKTLIVLMRWDLERRRPQ